MCEKVYEIEHIQLNVTCKDILLFKKTEIEADIPFVNIIIFYGKSFLYKCKMEKIHANLEMYAKYMTFKLDIICNTKCVYKTEYLKVKHFVQCMLN